MIEKLKKLTQIPAISGHETELSTFIKGSLSNYIFKNDHLGSLIVLNNNNGDAIDILINSHIDEAGFIVTSVTDKGLLKLQAVGSNIKAKPGMLLSTRFNDQVLNGLVIEQNGSEYLNVGLSNSKGYESIVGSMVTPSNNFLQIGNLIYSNALDNRVGVLLNEMLINNKYSNLNVASSFSTLSYLNSRGARTTTFITNPKLVINIDLVNINEINSVKQGEGPVLIVLDQGVILNNNVKNLITKISKEHNSKIQLLASNSNRFDTSTISLVEKGIHSVTIAIPAIYNESGQLVCIDDIDKTYELINLILKTITKDDLLNLYNY